MISRFPYPLCSITNRNKLSLPFRSLPTIPFNVQQTTRDFHFSLIRQQFAMVYSIHVLGMMRNEKSIKKKQHPHNFGVTCIFFWCQIVMESRNGKDWNERYVILWWWSRGSLATHTHIHTTVAEASKNDVRQGKKNLKNKRLTVMYALEKYSCRYTFHAVNYARCIHQQ